MHKEILASVYQYHHKKNRKEKFVLFGKERGEIFQKWIGKNKKVLDIGCRDGELTKYYVSGNDVLGVDIDKNALERCGRNLGIKTKWLDLNGNWKLGSERFDVVVAAEILEHLYYPKSILKKIKKVLKKGGILIGSVPNAFNLKNRLRILFGRKKGTPLQDPTHINHFSYKELEQILNREFKHVEIYPIGKHKNLIKLFPGMCSYLLIFKCKYKKTK